MLAAALGQLSGLAELSLADNAIRYEGTNAVLGAVTSLSSLTSMDLSHVGLEDHSVALLSDKLRAARPLFAASLQRNDLTEDVQNVLETLRSGGGASQSVAL